MENQKLLYIIAGANGSGKSTLEEVLLKEKNLEYSNLQRIKQKIMTDKDALELYFHTHFDYNRQFDFYA